ncbi:MAG: helix-turn-helix domain-containing protein [Stellaceae bacterium]
MSYDTIERHGKAFVLVPKAEYERIEAELDVRAYDRAKAKGQELIPAAVVDRLLAGENPIRVWREYRRLTLEQLADATGISKPYLSQIENGLRQATVNVLGRLAGALAVDLDQIVPPRGATNKKRPKRMPRRPG